MDSPEKKTFWSTLPSILTAAAFIIIAMAGLLLALNHIGMFSRNPARSQSPINPPDLNKVIFSDDFSGKYLRNNWQYVSGEWHQQSGVLDGSGSHYNEDHEREWAAITLSNDIPSDSSVSFRVKIIDGSTAELMLHLSNNKYIRVYIYEIDQAVELGEGTFIEDDKPGTIGLKEVLSSIGGGPTVVEHSFPIKLDTWYEISTTSKGNTYTVKIGGQQVIQYVDNENRLSREGTIGFLTNGHIQIDDVIVKSTQSTDSR